MLLDCAKLRHWDFEADLDALFGHRIDYVDWIELRREDRATVGILEPEWNNFDQLTADTKILHTTKRRTQPWKTGLPVDYTLRERGPVDVLRRLAVRRYQRHPDQRQQAYVYSLLAAMMEDGSVTREELVAEMLADHIRHDSLELVESYRGWTLDEPSNFATQAASAAALVLLASTELPLAQIAEVLKLAA